MNIVITGASRGIGYELVKLLSSNTENAIVAVSRNAAKLNRLKEECLSKNPKTKVISVACDLNNNVDLENLSSEIKKQFTSIDIVINNAGALVNKPFAEITTEDLHYVYGVNVFSVVRLTQQLLPLLKSAHKSHVINISSIGGFQGSLKFAGLSAYSSSKAALASLTECLAEEFKDSNISFNCLALGAVQTEMLNEAFPGYKAPLTANEMAHFIAHFAQTAHHFMNGKIIPVSLSNP